MRWHDLDRAADAAQSRATGAGPGDRHSARWWLAPPIHPCGLTPESLSRPRTIAGGLHTANEKRAVPTCFSLPTRHEARPKCAAHAMRVGATPLPRFSDEVFGKDTPARGVAQVASDYSRLRPGCACGTDRDAPAAELARTSRGGRSEKREPAELAASKSPKSSGRHVNACPSTIRWTTTHPILRRSFGKDRPLNPPNPS